jgi:hypothetical protein
MTGKVRTKPKRSVITIGVGVVLLLIGAGFLIFGRPHKTAGNELALADKAVARNQVELCSPYAGLCFTRPANWTRSKILHVKGSAGTTIEINPPTGTILQFAKRGKYTDTTCDKTLYASCTIMTHRVERLSNGLSVATGMLANNPPTNCVENCTPKFTPFVQLMTTYDVTAKGLLKSLPSYDSFNPGVGFRDNQKVYAQITPGKSFSLADSREWLDGSEAKTAAEILASTRRY